MADCNVAGGTGGEIVKLTQGAIAVAESECGIGAVLIVSLILIITGICAVIIVENMHKHK
jgi:hypothetical protein